MIQFKQEACQIIIFVAIQYGTQIYLLILFCRTLKSRKIWAKKVIKRLKLSPVFRDNLKILKIFQYRNFGALYSNAYLGNDMRFRFHSAQSK